jgi:hypothetical protein
MNWKVREGWSKPEWLILDWEEVEGRRVLRISIPGDRLPAFGTKVEIPLVGSANAAASISVEIGN